MARLSSEQIQDTFVGYSQEFQQATKDLGLELLPHDPANPDILGNSYKMPTGVNEQDRAKIKLNIWMPGRDASVPEGVISHVSVHAKVDNKTRLIVAETTLHNSASSKPELSAEDMRNEYHTVIQGVKAPIRGRINTLAQEQDIPIESLDRYMRRSLGLLAWLASDRFPQDLARFTPALPRVQRSPHSSRR